MPREIFVPHFFVPGKGRSGWRLVEGDEQWLEGVYADEALVTQMNGDDDALREARRGQAVEGRPTSSSSAPSLMAAMLHALDVTEGMTVLEVGTGSGYNAALLAQHLGDGRVTTIEVDPAVAQRARIALAAAGCRPTVATGNGAAGYPPPSPSPPSTAPPTSPPRVRCGPLSRPPTPSGAHWVNQPATASASPLTTHGSGCGSTIPTM